MPERILSGRRILIVEDEYLLADDLREELSDAGAEVLGPFPTVGEAASFVASGEPIDAALLDVNLRGEMIFPVADALRERAVPFVFATGYDQQALPERFSGMMRIEKPLRARRVAASLAPLLA